VSQQANIKPPNNKLIYLLTKLSPTYNMLQFINDNMHSKQ